MTEISRHIECVLFDNNCVIVPHLGGFVAHYVSAVYAEDEGNMYPPRRSVGFNPRLSLNDGLLVQSYMQENGVGYYEACGMIDRDVMALKMQLQECGIYEISRVGTLSLGSGGKFEFEPVETESTAPAFYGLSPFKLDKISGEVEAQEVASETSETEKSQVKVVSRRRREVANYVAAAIITLIFYFAWALPSYRDAGSESAASVPGVEVRKSPKKVVEAHNPVPAVQQKVVEKSAEKHESAAVAASREPAETKAFTLVLVTAVPQKNAEDFIRKLADSGCEGAEIKIQNNLLYVVYGRFVTQMDAWRALNGMQKTHPDFREAWILKLTDANL